MKTYYQKNKEKLLKYAKEYQRKKTEGNFPKIRRVLGIRIKEKSLKPFKKRISLELLARMEENTKINNEKIKFYKVEETKDTYLVQHLLKMKEIKI